MSTFIPPGLGWHPSLPDARDYNYRHEAVLKLLRGLRRRGRKTLPKEVDLRRDAEGEYFTTPEDQGPLKSSSVFAVLSLVEYFERRVRGHTFEGSKLFLYQVAANYLQKTFRGPADAGVDLRTTFKVLAQFGVPPEEHWPYQTAKFDEEPSSFLYCLARRFPQLIYFRLDPPNQDGTLTLEVVKSFLAAGFPVAFGFPVPTSLTRDATIPFRPHHDSLRGGQAGLAVGYTDLHPGPMRRALLIRPSWGSQWGDNGYGWLPVQYVERQLAVDFWTVASQDSLAESLAGEDFSRPTVVDAIKTM